MSSTECCAPVTTDPPAASAVSDSAEAPLVVLAPAAVVVASPPVRAVVVAPLVVLVASPPAVVVASPPVAPLAVAVASPRAVVVASPPVAPRAVAPPPVASPPAVVVASPPVPLAVVVASPPVASPPAVVVASPPVAPRAVMVAPPPAVVAASVGVVVVEAEVARMLQQLVSDAPVSWMSLPTTLTQAMELAEQVVGLTGPQKRQLVIDALLQLVRTVDKEAGISVADPVFEALLPSLVDHFVAVSKDGISVNVPTTPAGCFAMFCYSDKKCSK